MPPLAASGVFVYLLYIFFFFFFKFLHGWLAERKNSRSGKASLSVPCLFGNVMTTKAAPAQPPPRGTGDECSSVRERTEIKERKKKCHQDVIGGKAQEATVARK